MFSLKIILKESVIWVCIFFITCVAFLSAFIPYATSQILNYSVLRETDSLVKWLVIMILTIVLLLLFEAGSQYFTVKYQNRFKFLLTQKVSQRLNEKSSEEFLKKDKSEYISLYNNTIPILEVDFYKKILAVYQGMVGVLFNVSVLFVLDKVLLWVVVITSLIPLVIPVIVKDKLAMLKDNTTVETTVFNRKLSDFVEGFLVARTFNSQKVIFNKLMAAVTNVNQHKEEYEKTDASLNLIAGLAFYLSFILILIVGSLRISRGLTTIGALTGTIQIADNLIYPIRLVSEELRTLLSTKQIRYKLSRMVEAEAEVGLNQREEVSLKEAKAAVSIRDVSLFFKDKEIFNQLSFDFNANTKYLIIGESGIGKSTLLKMINGDINSFTGQIIVPQDLDIRFVYQAPYLFDGSLEENFTMFGKYDSPSRLDELKSRMNISVLDQSNESYSGGEVQKISLVRALQSSPDVLLLDEATSALDEFNYKFVETNLLNHFQGTLITISHRIDPEIKALYDVVLLVENNGLVVVN